MAVIMTVGSQTVLYYDHQTLDGRTAAIFLS